MGGRSIAATTAYQLGTLEYQAACDLQDALAAARAQGTVPDTLLLVQHPPVITVGRGGGWDEILAPSDLLHRAGICVLPTDRGGRATYHGPGQLVAYPILAICADGLHAYLWRLEEVVIRVLHAYGLRANRDDSHPGVWITGAKIAAVGLAVRDGVTRHGIALNVDPPMDHFRFLVPCGITDHGVTSMACELGRAPDLDEVTHHFVDAFAAVFECDVAPGNPALLNRLVAGHSPSPPAQAYAQLVTDHSPPSAPNAPPPVLRADHSRPPPPDPPVEAARSPHPRWLWRPVSPESEAAAAHISAMLGDLTLHTVCQEARCPNLAECFERSTATFLILGDRCTRGCRFCAVDHARPAAPDPVEPDHVAEAAACLGLRHVVITSVTRDDLPDGGAAHFAACVHAVRRELPAAAVELLVPDFAGSHAALEAVLDARPDVLNHNVETVPRLYRTVRPRADYRRSLALLARARALSPGLVTKSGLMLGLGERTAEVIQVLHDLRRAGCDLLTLGQYLQPTDRQLPVARYLPPAEFDAYRDKALHIGFRAVASGPLVRSSHNAETLFHSA